MNLNQITIKSIDVDQAVKFYLKLGLRLIVDSSPRYVRFECPQGNSTFSVSHTDQARDSSTVLYFETSDVDRSFKDLTAQGIQFASKPKDQSWLWREAALQDPDGHQLILFTAGNNRKYPPWRVKSRRWYDCLAESPVNLVK